MHFYEATIALVVTLCKNRRTNVAWLVATKSLELLELRLKLKQKVLL